MKKITTVIAEDEKNARQEIIYLLKASAAVDIVGEAENGIKALQLVRALNPELLIIDVEMPGKNGIEVVEKLREEQINLPQVIFLTAYSDFAVKAFQLEATDYVLKPVEQERLLAAIKRAGQRLEPNQASSQLALKQQNKISVKKGNRILLLDLTEIDFFHVADGLIFANGKKEKGLVNYKSLDQLAEELAEKNFVRCHRGYLVNIDSVLEVLPLLGSSYQLRIDNQQQDTIPMSRSYARKLRKIWRF